MDSHLKSGLFIPLYDFETLLLYLKYNIYGFLMKPQNGAIDARSKHYQALADFACTRAGSHVFFFVGRKIVYGGSIEGSADKGSFYLNGTSSPLGKIHNAKLCWDESSRYIQTEHEGIFTVNETNKCQPYIIKFTDSVLKGKKISSDDLYFELGKFGHPLPSNSISGMGFCTLTPAETRIALNLLEKSNENILDTHYSNEEMDINEATLFNGQVGFNSISEAYNNKMLVNEGHLEATLIANPSFLPQPLQPEQGDVICRQVPISPFKPMDMDRADICIYKEDSILNGALPNEIIELKKEKANKYVIFQVQRYLRWMDLVLTEHREQFNKVKISVLAPGYTRDVRSYILPEYKEMIKLYDFDGNIV
jgi:hypothetical protein